VIEAQFLLELLMGLFANPSGFDRRGELFEARIGWQVGHIVFLFARRPAFADKPDFLDWHALHVIVAQAVLMAVRNANTSSREKTCRAAFRSPAPADRLPFRVG
jgi:hypothetical protein